MSLRLRRMRIDRFGPLRDLDLELGALTVVVGGNEAGKSSIVDALHAWLRRSFRRANAVSWDGVRRNLPGYEGTVEVELSSALGSAPPAVLCEDPVLWNLLVIPEGRAGARRAGIAQRDWLVEAMPHLTGFDAQTIREQLRGRAGLTPTDRDAREWAEEGERLTRTHAAIEGFLADVASLGGREAELRARSVELQELERTAARERAAADFEPWRRAAAGQDELARLRTELARPAPGIEADVRTWRGLDVELARQTARRHAASLARARSEAKRRVAMDDRIAAERAAEDAERRLHAVVDADLARRATAATRSAAGPTTVGIGRTGVAASIAGAVLVAIGLATWSWLVVAGAAVVSGGLVMWLATRTTRLTRVPAREPESAIVDDARRLGIDASDPAAVLRGVGEIEADALRQRVRCDAARKQAAAADDEVEECVREGAAAEHAFSVVDRRIDALRERTGLADADALAECVERRARLEAQRDRVLVELASVLPGSSDDERERAIAAHRSEDPGVAPTPGELSRLERNLTIARAAVGRLERETIGALERGLQAIGERDLSSARATLEAAQRAQDDRRHLRAAARLALAVVDEAERDVEGHLDRAFADPVSGAGPLFARLTEGRFAGLRRVDMAVEALATDGSILRAEELSRGTHDQLHFALRAALAQRILGEPGFFVWDDTFLTADPSRRRTLVALAVDLVADGWQVVYLTVDPSIADLFGHEASSRAGIDCRIVRLGDRPRPVA